nr:hypothetical protein [Tanacetum cinerariifolium]
MNSDGSFKRYKARLVGDGRSQQVRIDCAETFSPVVKPATIRVVLSLPLSKSWSIHQLDVKNAFLHGHLQETVYMHHPMGFRDPIHPDNVCLLKKSLYGLEQAPRACYQRFADFVSSIGFIHSTHYSYTSMDVMSPISCYEFAMKDLGPFSHFLGIAVTRTTNEIASPEVIHEFHDSKGCTFLSEELPDIDSCNDIHPHFDDDQLSSSTTYSANSLLEEFADELALISYPPDYDDYHVCDIESDIREIKFLLFQGEDSDFKDSIDQSILANLDNLFVDLTPEMFTEEQPPDYSFPPRFNVYPDDFLEIESDANFDDDSFDSEWEKIKEAELLIDPLDLPCDILSEYDSFNS